MRESLLNVHLNDEQIEVLNAALCAYRDHFSELLELNEETEGPQARENNKYWQSKVHAIQELIDQVNDSLYGSQPREGPQ
ncbi:hypothetical protein ACWICO_16065 [Glutamicibacter sp. NPDC055491]